MGQQSQRTPENPFTNRNPITTPEMLHMFYGRERELQRLYEDLAKRQSVSLIGPREIGKTSFLWCACQQAIQERFNVDLHNHLFVHLDLRESVYEKADDFLRRASEAIFRQGKLRRVNLSLEGSGAERFLSVVDQVSNEDLKLVLLLDAFEAIARNPQIGPEFLSFLRSQSSNGKVTYVTATVEPLYELGHKGIKDSPFFNIFDEIKLAELTREEAEQLIREPAERVCFPFTVEEAEWIVKNAGLHPCFIMRSCEVLFGEKLLSTRHKVSEQHFKARAYKALLPHFQDSWNRLSEKERTVIRDEVQQKKNQGQLAQQDDVEQEEEKSSRQLPELTESAFFRQFVRDINKIGLFKMTVEELEEALERMHDLAALGKTNLRLMKVVGYRLNGNSSPTEIERGKVIQGVLREALERLRGNTLRKDVNPEWLFYNILDYRYFTRYRLKHREISVRLEFNNDRQYYRRRNDALAALLNVLFEMEALE